MPARSAARRVRYQTTEVLLRAIPVRASVSAMVPSSRADSSSGPLTNESHTSAATAASRRSGSLEASGLFLTLAMSRSASAGLPDSSASSASVKIAQNVCGDGRSSSSRCMPSRSALAAIRSPCVSTRMVARMSST